MLNDFTFVYLFLRHNNANVTVMSLDF